MNSESPRGPSFRQKMYSVMKISQPLGSVTSGTVVLTLELIAKLHLRTCRYFVVMNYF